MYTIIYTHLYAQHLYVHTCIYTLICTTLVCTTLVCTHLYTQHLYVHTYWIQLVFLCWPKKFSLLISKTITVPSVCVCACVCVCISALYILLNICYTGWSKSVCVPDTVYLNNPHTTDDFKMAITEYIRNVDRAVLNSLQEHSSACQ